MSSFYRRDLPHLEVTPASLMFPPAYFEKPWLTTLFALLLENCFHIRSLYSGDTKMYVTRPWSLIFLQNKSYLVCLWEDSCFFPQQSRHVESGRQPLGVADTGSAFVSSSVLHTPGKMSPEPLGDSRLHLPSHHRDAGTAEACHCIRPLIRVLGIELSLAGLKR